MTTLASTNQRANPVSHPQQGASVVQYAVLGLLGVHPAHGYDLQRRFGPGGELGDILPLEQPTLYAALKDLARRGLIEGAEQREGHRPPRTVYRLTAEGEAALEGWLARPVRRLREIRLDFLLKVYVARRRGPDAVRALVDAQIDACRTYLADLEAERTSAEPASFAQLVRASRVSAARGTLAWLMEYREAIV